MDYIKRLGLLVARSTRAWIETGAVIIWTVNYSVARSTRAWIETDYLQLFLLAFLVARSTRAWIETPSKVSPSIPQACRTLYACVD